MKKHHLTYTFIIAHIILFSRVFAADAQSEEPQKGSYVCTIEPGKKQVVRDYDVRKKLYELTPPDQREELKPLETKRLLSCTGGGTKGLLPAVMLAYLEELINSDFNAERRKEILVGLGRPEGGYLYIGDLFDGAAGTSTGGILAAGLMFNGEISGKGRGYTRYTAIEIAQVYARYCDRLFGFSINNIVQRKSICQVGTLENLFSLYFGDSEMHTAFNGKHVEFFACDNTTDATPYCLSVDGDFKELKVITSLRSTTAVPYLYPSSTIELNGRRYNFQDGGLRTNFPGYELFRKQQNKDGRKKYELYAFGTGYSQSEKDKDSTILQNMGKKIVGPVSSFEQEARKDCKEAVEGPGNPLTFFAHMNPKLCDGMHLASSGPCFVENAIKSALNEVNTDAFKKIVEQLEFKLPEDVQLDVLKGSVKNKLEAFDHSIIYMDNNVQNDHPDRKTGQKWRIVQYIERQILKYKNYDFFVRGYCYMMKDGKLEKWEGQDFIDFLNTILKISKNEKFKNCVKLYLDSVSKISAITPLNAEDFSFLINHADDFEEANKTTGVNSVVLSSLKDELSQNGNALTVADSSKDDQLMHQCAEVKSADKEAGEESAGEEAGEESADEEAGEESAGEEAGEESAGEEADEVTEEGFVDVQNFSEKAEQYREKIDSFLRDYITFLKECNHTNYDSNITPLLADLFLVNYLRNVDLNNKPNITVFVRLIQKIIHDNKNKDGYCKQGVRYVSSMVGLDAGGSRWNELTNGLERYIKSRTTFEFDNASLETEAFSPKAGAAAEAPAVA